MTRLIYERRFTYPVPGGSVTTRARVFRPQAGLDVLIANDDENPGPSITKTIECLANAAVEEFGLDFERLAVYQHYDYRTAGRQPTGEPVTYDEVVFEWANEGACRPQWYRRSRWSLSVLLALDSFDTIAAS